MFVLGFVKRGEEQDKVMELRQEGREKGDAEVI